MSYLHCHNCHWSQDDFWDEWYNPITFLEHAYKKELLTKDLWEVLTIDSFDNKRNKFIGMKPITREKFITDAFEQMISKIQRMIYRTNDEFKAMNPEGKCPNCWKKELDID